MAKIKLTSPFSWEERRPLISDRVFYVPRYFDRHEEFIFPGWESIFANQSEVHIEYCSGNGDWIAAKALEDPEKNWVAVEKRFDRVGKIWSKMQRQQIANLFIVCGEALELTQHYIASDTICGIYVNFPDPWPKPKHSKHRLLQEPFLSEMARIAKPKAKLTIVTDHSDYLTQVRASLLSHPSWRHFFYDTHYEAYGSSYFGDLWKKRGLTIHYLQYKKETPHD